MPFTNANAQKTYCGRAGSSPGIRVVIIQGARTTALCDSREMTEIILVHRAVNPSPRIPKTMTKRMSRASFVPKPQRKRHEKADPTHETPRTHSSGNLSDKNPSRLKPGTEAARYQRWSCRAHLTIHDRHQTCSSRIGEVEVFRESCHKLDPGPLPSHIPVYATHLGARHSGRNCLGK